MKKRLLFGPVLIAVLVAGLWLDGWLDRFPTPAWMPKFVAPRETLPPGFIVFVVSFVLCILAARELAAILRAKGITASTRLMCAAAGLGLVVSCMVPSEQPGQVAVAIVGISSVAVLVAALAFFSRNKTTQGVVAATGGVLLAYVYLGLALGFVPAIRREHSAWVLFWVLGVTKSSDIGAYFTGKSIGKHKLIVWLSPGKTWEGLFGGVVFAAATGALGVWGLNATAEWGLSKAGEPVHVLPAAGAVCGALFALVGQTGDLLASLLKRDAGKKDSSTILPGFGGMLDVIDSPLLVAPVAYWLLRLVTGASGPV